MRKVSYLLCAILGILATNLSAIPASAAGESDLNAAPPAEQIVIDLVTTNGSGCPPGSATITVAPDNSAFTVTYSNYTARVGVGAVPTDVRKNCQLNVVLRVPQGFTYALSQADYRGVASIATGAGAVQRAYLYYAGQSQTPYSHHTFAGPAELDWLTVDELPLGPVWSPCEAVRNVNINTELRATAGTSDTRTTTSFISLASSVYYLSWAQCP
jgi:hypothetical protein